MEQQFAPHDAVQQEIALKQAARERVRASRRARSARDREAARDALAVRLRELVLATNARRVACYAPIPSEPDTSAFLTWAHKQGIEVLLPISLPGSTLEWARFDGAALEAGRHGIAEPTGERLPAATAAELDLLIIPACAVDAHGTRLGWGLGYYDRMLDSLATVPPIYAVVFDDDVLPELPRAPHDVPVDGVVTPGAVRRFAAG